jgi:hypothetical protein
MTTALSAPMPLGHKNAPDIQGDRRLGEVFIFRDVLVANGRLVRERRGEGVMARLVKADATITPGHALEYTAYKYGTHVDAVATENGRVDGIADPTLSSIASGDIFWLIIGGPVDVTVSEAISTEYVRGGGAGKVKTATIGTDIVSGRVLEDATGKSDGNTIRVHLLPQSNS